jgi:hypothetical protein
MNIVFKLKIKLPYNSVTPLMGYTWKSACSKDTCTLMFTVELLTIAKLWNQSRTTNRWSDKEIVVYIHNGVLFGHEEQNQVIFRKVDGTGISYSKWNKPDSGRQWPHISLMWGI